MVIELRRQLAVGERLINGRNDRHSFWRSGTFAPDRFPERFRLEIWPHIRGLVGSSENPGINHGLTHFGSELRGVSKRHRGAFGQFQREPLAPEIETHER